MSESGSQYPQGLVPHPRFGDGSVPSGYNVPLEVIRACYCYDRPPVFPKSAIPADVSRQNYSVRPRLCYVDMLRGCRKCGRDFIFFAREQQYWYEQLGFWVEADCVHCPECRRSDHRLRQRFQRFSQAISKGNVNDEELATLVDDAVSLSEAGVLRSEQKLRRLKNLARARIPDSPAYRAILERITALGEQRGNIA
jgi:hypothetical protein